MQSEATPPEAPAATVVREDSWNTVTPLSKFLAMALFVALPFVGGYVGYTFSPEKMVEIPAVTYSPAQLHEQTEIGESGRAKFVLLGGDYYLSVSEITNEEKIFYRKTYRTRLTSSNGEYLHTEHISFIEIPGANVNSFQVDENHSDFAKDDTNVYYYWWSPFEPSDTDGVRIIEGADPETFEAKIVRLFNVSQGNTYQGWISRDKNHVYYRDEVIPGANPHTYVVGENVSVNYDDDNVFLWHEAIPRADPESYTIVFDTSSAARGTVFGRDVNNCYKDYEVISCDEMPATRQAAEAL